MARRPTARREYHLFGQALRRSAGPADRLSASHVSTIEVQRCYLDIGYWVLDIGH